MGRLILQIYLLGILIIPFVYLLVWLVVWKELDYVIHELNPIWYELLHLWNILLACFFFWGNTLLCLRFVPVLF